MTNRSLVQLLTCLILVLGCNVSMLAAQPLDILDLVPPDSALCLEIRQLDKALASMDSTGLLSRLCTFRPFQQWLESDIVKKWQRIEGQFIRKTRQSLAGSVRRLCAKSLVLSLRLPVDGDPVGVLIVESVEDDVIPGFIKTWNDYEKETVTIAKSHRGLKYFQRKKPAAPRQTLYFATFAHWFALSSQESCIQDLIDQFLRESDRPAQQKSAGDLSENSRLSRCRESLGSDADVFLHINARPWDKAIDELSTYWQLDTNLSGIWQHISSISSCIRLDQGLVCDATVALNKSDFSDEWQQVVATASAEKICHASIPPEAVLVFGCQLEFKPIFRFFANQQSSVDVARLSRFRHGAQEPFDVVLSAFANNLTGYLLESPGTEANNLGIDGLFCCDFDAAKDRALELDVGRAMGSLLNLRAASLSTDQPKAITVKRELTDSRQLEWLSEPVAFPSAFGISNHRLVIAGSEESLRKSLNSPAERHTTKHRSDELCQRYPQANQFLWLDTIKARHFLKHHKLEIVKQLCANSSDETSRITNWIDLMTAEFSLIDSMFIASQIKSEAIQLTFHGGLNDQ